jgi:drug/metabolite transporter (DMT)-like permease
VDDVADGNAVQDRRDSRGDDRGRTSPATFLRQVVAELRKVVWPTRDMVPILLGIGALDVLANGALIFAYQQGMLSLVSVVAALYPAATVLLAMIVLGERVGRLRLLGMLAAGVAVALISVAA